jgi:hypothetical protein
MMGSGGMIVMDDTICMVEVARYYVDFLCEESCAGNVLLAVRACVIYAPFSPIYARAAAGREILSSSRTYARR